MSSELTQSGREAAAERAATLASMWGEGPGSHPSIFPTSDWETQVEARKAAGAWREELLRPIPPRLLGREAFSQDPQIGAHPRWTPEPLAWPGRTPWLHH